MCGFQRLASRIATLPAAPAGFVPAARIGARSHHARSCSAFSNDSRVRKSPITRQKNRRRRRKPRAPEPAIEPPAAPVAVPSRRAAAAGCAGSRRYAQPAAPPSGRHEPEPEEATLETVEIVPPPMQDASAKRSWLDSPEDRSVENEFEPDGHFRRREDRRRSVRRTRNRAADVGRGRRRHRIPARIVARESAQRAPYRSATGQGRAAHAARSTCSSRWKNR